MNKYQEALDYIESIVIDEDVLRIFDSPNYPPLIKNHIKLLQELVDQTKTPTEEEIIKEWEALGYKWKRDNSNNINKGKITLTKLVKAQCNFDVEIHIWIHPNKTYYSDCDIDFQEHQLLTKTFKMLGWEV